MEDHVERNLGQLTVQHLEGVDLVDFEICKKLISIILLCDENFCLEIFQNFC